MNTRPNGTPDENRQAWLALYPGWVITVTGRLLVGQLHSESFGDLLSPVYDLLALPRPTAQGLATFHVVAPVLGLPSITTIDITATRQARVAFVELSPNDLETIASMVFACQKSLAVLPEAQKLTDTGLVTAGT
ncbi:MAG TPA: hypothetical protein VM690_10080, partial [Gaiellaceae bacterium]|nr:hypothetical protein [Gaiellaceae bacterium]